MPTVSELIGPFFAWKQGPNRRFAESSRIKYEPHLHDLARWAGSRKVAEITSAHIEFDYLPGWATAFAARRGHPAAPNSVRLLHNVLSSFFDYVWRRGLMPLNPMLAIPRPMYEAPLNDWLSAQEDQALATVRMSPLEDIVCGLARLAGLRADEIARLLQGQVDLEGGLLHVYGTKSEASIRSVVVFPELAVKLESWLAYQRRRGINGEFTLLVSTADGGPVAKTYLWRIVKRVAARAGVRLHGLDAEGRPVAIDESGENVSEISTHTLRRTFGSDLLNRGARIEVVSAQLGHSDIKVTQKAYAKLLTATQRNELLRLGSGYPFLARTDTRRSHLDLEGPTRRTAPTAGEAASTAAELQIVSEVEAAVGEWQVGEPMPERLAEAIRSLRRLVESLGPEGEALVVATDASAPTPTA